MRNYIFALLMLVFFSCGSDVDIVTYKVVRGDSIEERTSQRFELKGENFGPQNRFGQLIDISIVNGAKIVQDNKSEYAFWRLEGEDDLISFQVIGEGPNEVENADFVKMVNNIKSSNELIFFDYSRKSLNSVSISPNSGFKKYSDIPDQYWGRMQSAVNISDSLIAITGLFDETKFMVFNGNNQQEAWRSVYANSFSTELSEEERLEVAPRSIEYNEKNDMIVLSNPSVNSIDLFSVNGSLVKMYSFDEFENLTTESIFSPDFFYYYGVKTQENLVYGLYLGVERKTIDLQDLFLSSTRPELHIYNLLTDDLLRYRLDRVVNACVIDANNNVVYCIDEDNEDQPLVKYEISEIF
ncbi:hypothetical protein SAMN05444359_1513 [Neolewinella agarilytica]|uniref:TolB-like 6-blade propeller-like n=2 Tax=Neolewinella agarilytica TaxID=478744 RepID=A0A1H9PGM0_9BACT|nr:hypothetical protein SAMN05444359_1513 [Neolewinella agarilytica]